MPLLCTTCGPTGPLESSQSPALRRMEAWQERMAVLWGAYPIAHNLVLRSAPLWAAAALLAAFFDATRAYSAPLVVIAVLVASAREFVPLAPVPFNVYNAVASRDDAYATAAKLMLAAMLGLATLGVIVAVSESFGASAHHHKTGFSESPPSYWASEPLPWVSSALLVAPVVYFGSLTVSAKLAD